MTSETETAGRGRDDRRHQRPRRPSQARVWNPQACRRSSSSASSASARMPARFASDDARRSCRTCARVDGAARRAALDVDAST